MNIKKIREQFPMTEQVVPVLTEQGWEDGKLIYLDNGASTPMAKFLQEELARIYNSTYSNVHRGAHYASKVSTEMFEQARKDIAAFFNGQRETHEVIFGYNTTDVLSLAAHVTAHLDGIVLTTDIEHHSNYLPFLRYGDVNIVGVHNDGSLNMDDLEAKLKKNKVKLVAVTGCSNVTGFIPNLKEVSNLAHEHGAYLLIDGAQIIAHYPLDAQEIGIDFLAGAGHKFYCPGSAFLYGRRDVMNDAEPYKPGGGTVNYVINNDLIGYRQVPDRHEGGTPHIVGAILMSKALNWLKEIGMENVREHELELLKSAWGRLSTIDGVELYGPTNLDQRAGVISFNVADVNNGLTAAILNYEGGIAVRNGCHCAHRYLTSLLKVKENSLADIISLMERREHKSISQEEHEQIPGTARAVIGVFTNQSDVDHFVEMVERIAKKKWIGTYEFRNGEYIPKEWDTIDLSRWPELQVLKHNH